MREASGPPTKIDAPGRTELHQDHVPDQRSDHGTTLGRPTLDALGEAVLEAVAEGKMEALDRAEDLVAAVLEHDVVRRARELHELLRTRSPFALVRAVELAEVVLTVERARRSTRSSSS